MDEPTLGTSGGTPEPQAQPRLLPDPPIPELPSPQSVDDSLDLHSVAPRPEEGAVGATTFERPDAVRLGIAGGRKVGKSYLFQAMVYRTLSGTRSGALTPFLENGGVRLFSALGRHDVARAENPSRFIDSYSRWERLEATHRSLQRWYRLRLGLRSGLLGHRRGALDIDYLDASGEGFFQGRLDRANADLWSEGFLDARVMVFCLPLWVAFPRGGLSAADREERSDALVGLVDVLENFTQVREHQGRTGPVTSILALTMADDGRVGLPTLRERWIFPYLDSPGTYLEELRSGAGVARYLNNAYRMSQALQQEFMASSDPRVSGLPGKLDLGRGRPWLIPLSAIEGAVLDQAGVGGSEGKVPERPPVPVHVELPLLVALCEATNGLA
jgi:hypothetical protein